MDSADGLTDGDAPAAEPDVRTPKVFINYRRDDAASDARLLYEKLVSHFAAENVFLDVEDIHPGMKWLEEIKARSESSGVFLALIGPAWMPTLTQRLRAGLLDTTEDVVKQEIEFALSRGSRIAVVPVLVGGASMPQADRLPKSMRGLGAMEAVTLRHDSFSRDVEHLIAKIGQIGSHIPARPQRTGPAEGAAGPDEPVAATSGRSSRVSTSLVPAPDDRHFETVIRHMVDRGTVVPVLGPSVCGSFPDADRIAAKIADELNLEMEAPDLPKVAQHLFVSSGRSDLHRALKRILDVEPEPGPAHQFFARFPGEVERLGRPPHHQLIITTNYDSALERAFDEQNEPYDLAVYMASGEDQGRFVHFPYDGYPEAIAAPNEYPKFPIDDFGELSRTLIVKVHGAADGSSEGYGWRDNYVITEDHYIDYLSRGPVESLVPFQILNKLTESHCLFLGYALQDWNLRVFLKRIWKGEQLGSKSWAIESEPDDFELDFWRQLNVDLFASLPDGYVCELERRIRAYRDPVA